MQPRIWLSVMPWQRQMYTVVPPADHGRGDARYCQSYCESFLLRLQSKCAPATMSFQVTDSRRNPQLHDHECGEPQAGSVAPSRDCLRLSARDLMGSRSEVVIIHEGREYTLRITRNRKLILTA
ncbi:MAG: hemin uptake protein HemP [Burkholderiales bacterium]